MTELTANQSTISLSTPKYTNYLFELKVVTDPSLIQDIEAH